MSKRGEGRDGRRYLPYAFTEHGVAMLSSVLNSERAVAMNILIIRAFVKLREILATHKDLAGKIEELGLQQEVQASHIANINEIIKSLTSHPQQPKRRPIGFLADTDINGRKFAVRSCDLKPPVLDASPFATNAGYCAADVPPA
jgi:hypothetical protein